MSLYVLFESSIGYGLFQLKEFDELNTTVAKVQKEIKNFETFSKTVHLKVSIQPHRPSSPSSPPNELSSLSTPPLQAKPPKNLSPTSLRVSL